MSVREDALTLIDELRAAGRITTVEARALIAGVGLSQTERVISALAQVEPEPVRSEDIQHLSPGSIITVARKAKRLTQRQLADRLDISVQAVSQWETDKARVNPGRISKLSGILGIDAKLLVPTEYQEALTTLATPASHIPG